MKAIIRFSILMAIFAITSSVCSAQDKAKKNAATDEALKQIQESVKALEQTMNKESDPKKFTVKSASIAYKGIEDDEPYKETLIFDDYGALCRIELKGDKCLIGDATAKKAYIVDHAKKTWCEDKTFNAFTYLNDFVYKFKGDKRPNRTVAGKTCTVGVIGSMDGPVTRGGWNGMLFLKEWNHDTFSATSYSETIPAKSFDVPAGYKKVDSISMY